SVDISSLLTTDPGAPVDTSACVQRDSERAATVTWRQVMPNRVRRPTTSSVALIHDIYMGQDISMLAAETYNVTSSLTFDTGAGCADTGSPHPDLDIAADATVRIAMEPVRAGTDGIFGGAGVYNELGVAVPNETFAITGTTTRPFAVWLRFGSSVDTL